MEYILLLVITVSLVIGAKKAFGNLNDFMNRYIGDYVVCLMEYGELPSLGVSDATQKNHSGGTGKQCDQQFAGFTFEGGRSPTGGGGSIGGSGTTTGGKSNSPGGKNSSPNAGNSSKGSSAASKSKSDSDSGSDKNNFGSSGRSNKGSSPYSKGEIKRSGGFGTSDSGSDIAGQKTRVIEDEDELKRKRKYGFGAISRTQGSGNGERYRAITGTMEAEIEKRAPKKLRAPTASIKPLLDDRSQFGPYRKSFTPPVVKKIEQKEDNNSGFSFGYIIRWLIIGGMILAIIVFFGGQIMNYSNSKE